MNTLDSNRLEAWPRCPEAAEYFISLFRAFASHNPAVAEMADRMLDHAGVPMVNLIDHWVVPNTPSLADELTAIGLCSQVTQDGDAFWGHASARLPRLRIAGENDEVRLAIAVEDLRLFADCNDLTPHGQLGDPDSGYEEIRIPQPAGELAVVVRTGYSGFRPGRLMAADQRALQTARSEIRNRPRAGEETRIAEQTSDLMRSLSESVEMDRLVDEFFHAERDYYMSRNSAARRQYQRQQDLGIGWANHDHHTFRSAREGFRALVNLWLQLGFEPREKFYAGAEAGWGAQIFEHPVSRVVLFCDVDMAPEEINIEYSRHDLPPLPQLGTIGLWCGLHGSSLCEAGLHHLEAEFDFARERSQLVSEGIGVMAPFTDLPILKQAFTEAETWPVEPARANRLFDLGLISAAQRDQFLDHGAHGSHLEILQRWEGFKGFNKTGIDAIIKQTDARNAGAA
jgi:hypothetical protein